MFSKQHYTTPSLTKVLGSNGCDALRRFQGQHCMTFPGEVVPLNFSFCLLHFFLVFWGQFFFLWSFFVFVFFLFFFLACQGVFSLGVAIWVKGFLPPTPNDILLFNFSFFSPKEGGNIAWWIFQRLHIMDEYAFNFSSSIGKFSPIMQHFTNFLISTLN